ncbi:Collagen alpha-1(XIV) chain [Liparis tanakae]|uniref:Collagen alpha-1(XIV) chain n=1 Tax=Liparis tanakae TaxID=230148 RepID=A0A4Z2GFZ7_9TELE|nr:Collagen alpha-1(XIV) chain [Liparis tanakae]
MKASADQFVCHTEAIADIVILVDGSWSIGRLNFRLVRMFLENLIDAFDVGIDKTRIGLALTYILENCFKQESGSRVGIPKIGILITDGKSQDDVIPPAESLRNAGIELFAIGVKNADENELLSIASEPDTTHVYNVADFNVMSSIVQSLTKIVCEQVEQQDKDIKQLTALQLLDVTHSTMKARWDRVDGVSGYMLLYAPLIDDGDLEEKEVKVSEAVTELELDGLTPRTEYTVTVYAVYGEEASDPITNQKSTLPLSAPTNLQFSDITHNSAHIHWDPVPKKVKGYRIMWVKTDGLFTQEVEVGPDNSYDLSELTSLMEYSVAIVALYTEGQSEALTDGFTTTPVPGPLHLRTNNVGTDSFQVSWDHSANDIILYRLSWAPFTGGVTKEVILSGIDNKYKLSGLSSSTDYEVMLTAVFKDESESDTVSVLETTWAETTTIATTTPMARQAVRNLLLSDETTRSMEASWELEDPHVESYRVSFADLRGKHQEESVS